MKYPPQTKGACELLLRGSLALSQMEGNGVRVDIAYLDQQRKDLAIKITEGEERLRQAPEYRAWQRRYGARANLGSAEQLGRVLFEELGHKSLERTATGRFRADEAVLSRVKIPFVQDYLRVKKQKKLASTFLSGLKRETVEGYFHPSFNLHLAATYRSSSGTDRDNVYADKDLNFQNLPVRRKDLAESIRRCFIARPGHRIVETDFGAIEVRISACYHKDPTMVEYLHTGYDMHKDMACECFLLKPEQVTKDTRGEAKNKFVFPQFYGDFFATCAKSLWRAAEDGLTAKYGDEQIPMLEHLARQGIDCLGDTGDYRELPAGSFMAHMQEVEHRFWDERFSVYSQWKRNWWQEYLKKGYIDTYTGFRIGGLYERNKIINYPVQSAAFHCLLWSIIQMQNWINTTGKKTLLVGQIHDSLLADVPEDEVDEYLKKCVQVMTVDLPRHWKWINVPMVIEAKVSPTEGSWHECKEVSL